MRFSEAEQQARAEAIVKHHSLEGVNPGVGVAIRPGDLLLVTMPAMPNSNIPVSDVVRETPCLGKGGDSVDAAVLDPKVLAILLPEEMHKDPRGILFEFTEKNDDVDEHARGGRKVSGGGYQCTSGFSVYRSVHALPLCSHARKRTLTNVAQSISEERHQI